MEREERVAAGLLTGTATLGAWLLFSSELIVGRIVTPLYGGASSVWLVCLMSYQGLLLLGYLYAHLVGARLGKWHLAVAMLPAVNMPLSFHSALSMPHPSLEILVNLLISIALPFTLLATTAVMTQLYWQRSWLGQRRPPWRLYSASNVGSLAALLLYPTLIEPFVPLSVQRWAWSAGWLLYLLLLAASFRVAKPQLGASTPHTSTPRDDSGGQSSPAPGPAPGSTPGAAPSPSPSVKQQGRWLALSAVPSGMLVVVSSVLGSEIGALPMLWTAPLTLYILTFILLFTDRGERARRLCIALWPELSVLGLALWLFMAMYWLWVVLFLACFFGICLATHGQLYEDRPQPTHLTRYYLLMSLGGGLGGAATTLLPPLVFDSLAELPLTLAAFFLLMLWTQRQRTLDYLKRASILKVAPRLLVLLSITALWIFAAIDAHKPSLTATRNFYGIFRVVEEDRVVQIVDRPEPIKARVRKLMHGQTIHGIEALDGPLSRSPLAYYHLDGSMGQVYKLNPEPKRIAAIGLGSGAMAAHAKPSDTLKFYEIDPDNEALARRWFSFLEQSPAAPIQVEVGDGRKLLERERGPGYDLIHLDAFSGDGIPSHLLTVEAARIYLDRLTPSGVLLFHVSNRYYELRPLLRHLAIHLNLHAFYNSADPAITTDAKLTSRALLVVMSRDRAAIAPLLQTEHWEDLVARQDVPEVALWTDERSNVLGSLMLWTRFPGGG